MTLQGFLKLAVETVSSPRYVARLLLATRLSKEAVWTAFAAVLVLNAVVYGATLVLDPAPAGVPIFLSSPLFYLAAEGVTLFGTIVCVTLIGRLLGGAGRMTDVALLLVWLQALNLIVQAVTALVLPLSPGLAGLLVLVASGLGFWILLNFIDEAHGLGSLFKAFVVFLLGLLALGFALSVLLTVAGVTPEGMMGNV